MVYWGLTPQQQPESYRGSDDDDDGDDDDDDDNDMMMMKCQFHWWRNPEHPEETTNLRQETDKLSHIYGNWSYAIWSDFQT